MKKIRRTAAAACLALAGAFMLGAAGCHSEPAPASGLEESLRIGRFISSEPVSELEGYTVSSVDGSGIARIYRNNDTATEYGLYDLTNGEMVVSKKSEFERVSGYSGFYYTLETETQGTSPELTYKYTYTFYDGAVKAETVVQDSSRFIVSDGIGTFADGKVIYKDVAGEVYYGERGVRPVATSANAFKMGNYYVVRADDSVYGVFDRNGRFLRTTDKTLACDVPEGTPVQQWQVGSRLFEQYRVSLPDDAANYDYYSGNTKYDLQTYYFDVLTGEGGEADLGVLVTSQDVSADPGRYAALTVRGILKNKTLSSETYLQTFGADGKVYVDLQSLLPGADAMSSPEEGYLVLANNSQAKIYRNGRLYAELSAFTGAEWAGGGYFADAAGKTIYDANMKEVFTLPEDARPQGVYGGNVYYITEEEQSDGSAPKYFLYIYKLSAKASILMGEVPGTRLSVAGGRFYMADGIVRDLYDASYTVADAELAATEVLTASLSARSLVTETNCLYLISVNSGEKTKHFLVKYGLNGTGSSYTQL